MGNQSKQRNIRARKKLQALYERGEELRFTTDGYERGPFEEPIPDDDETTVAIWVAPPSPLQRDMALREAQASRAKSLLSAKGDDESADAMAARSFLSGLRMDDLIDYVLQMEEGERKEEAEREVLGKEEWEDFDALQDAMRQWDEAGNPRDDEWKPLIDRDIEFGNQVREEMNRLRVDAREGLKLQPRSELEKRAFDRRVELIATQSFMESYEANMLFYACRDPEDKQELFFEDVNDLLSQEEIVQMACAEVLAGFVQDPREAKNSQRAASGSDSAELPDEQETSEASTPQEATA